MSPALRGVHKHLVCTYPLPQQLCASWEKHAPVGAHRQVRCWLYRVAALKKHSARRVSSHPPVMQPLSSRATRCRPAPRPRRPPQECRSRGHSSVAEQRMRLPSLFRSRAAPGRPRGCHKRACGGRIGSGSLRKPLRNRAARPAGPPRAPRRATTGLPLGLPAPAAAIGWLLSTPRSACKKGAGRPAGLPTWWLAGAEGKTRTIGTTSGNRFPTPKKGYIPPPYSLEFPKCPGSPHRGTATGWNTSGNTCRASALCRLPRRQVHHQPHEER